MTQQTLKPCPHCGADAILTEHEPHEHSPTLVALGLPGKHPGNFTIECVTCECGMINANRAGVIAAWNRRATPSAPAVDAPARLDENTIARLKLLCRMLGIEKAFDDDLYADPEALFSIFGSMRFHLERALSASTEAAGIVGPLRDDQRQRAISLYMSLPHSWESAESVITMVSASAYTNGAKDASTEAAAGEPVYQISVDGVAWKDVHFEFYQRTSSYTHKRIVYTAPPAASGQKLTDEQHAVLRLCIVELSAWMRDHGEDLRSQEAIKRCRALLRASSATASDKAGQS